MMSITYTSTRVTNDWAVENYNNIEDCGSIIDMYGNDYVDWESQEFLMLLEDLGLI